MLSLVPLQAARILDVGCSNGALGGELKRRQSATVWGIDSNAAFAAQAEERLDRVLRADAEHAIELLEGERFDCVVCADVLEHLVDPGTTLAGLCGLLAAGGSFVISLPNVRFYDTFVQLGVNGVWPRRDRGVHDRTHLHWFTDRDARELFLSAGLVVVDTTTNYRLRDQPRGINRLAPPLARGPLRPFLAYQYLYRLEKVGPSR